MVKNLVTAEDYLWAALEAEEIYRAMQWHDPARMIYKANIEHYLEEAARLEKLG